MARKPTFGNALKPFRKTIHRLKSSHSSRARHRPTIATGMLNIFVAGPPNLVKNENGKTVTRRRPVFPQLASRQALVISSLFQDWR